MTPADPVVALVVASAVVLAAVRVPRSAARISPGRRAHAAGAGRSTGPRAPARAALVRLVAGVAVAAVVGAGPALVAAGSVVIARVVARRRVSRQRRRRIDRALPDALDLFVVSISAGQRPAECFALLAPLVDPVLSPSWHHVVRRLERGDRLTDAVAVLGDELGSGALAFASTLTATEAAGLALAPAVDQLADEARQHRRRAADAAARELPVRLSFPLVLCTLPSFVLVAIVPLLLGALSSLRAT